MNKPIKITMKNSSSYIEEAIQKKDYDTAFALLRRFRQKGFSITLSGLKKQYKLTKEEIDQLPYSSVKNPHYATAQPMRLYLIAQIEELIQNRTCKQQLNK